MGLRLGVYDSVLMPMPWGLCWSQLAICMTDDSCNLRDKLLTHSAVQARELHTCLAAAKSVDTGSSTVHRHARTRLHTHAHSHSHTWEPKHATYKHEQGSNKGLIVIWM